MTTRLKSKCPECNQTLKCDESLIGRQVRCPACRHRFVLSSIAFSNESDAVAVSMEATATGAEDQTVSSGESSQRPRPADEPTIGKIGRFELKQALGQGAFGKVYRAYDPVLSRHVALKVPKFTGEEKKKVRRFLTEAKAAAGLRHPNIVAVYESGQADGELYIAAEYVRGRSLAECIEGVLPDFREAAAWIRDLAGAFAYAHDEGVIHRDIKPQNVMIGGKGRPQIMDFGLAKLMDDDSSVTGDGALLGTPAYMSPEQARGELEIVGPQSDQYSLAVVFYELMTGQKPFDGPAHSVIARVAKDEPPPPNKHNAEIPKDLEAICLKAMEKDPSRRYSDLHKMAEDLDRWLTGAETIARPIGRSEKIKRWCRRNPLVACLSATIVLMVAVGFAGISIAWGRAIISENAAVAALVDTRVAEEKAARRLATIEMERGLALCEEGDVAEGLLWLGRSLGSLSEDDPSLHDFIRRNLASWSEEIVATPVTILDHESVIICGAMTPDGTRAVTGSRDGSIRIWNLKTLNFVESSEKHSGEISKVSVSPDGLKFATVGYDQSARVWNISDGTPVTPPLKHGNILFSVAFSSDSSMFMTGGLDGHSRLWNTATGEPVRAPTAHKRWVFDIAFHPDGKTFLTNDGDASSGKFVDGASLRDVQTGKRTGQFFQVPSESESVAISPNGRLFAVGSRGGGKVLVWDASTGKTLGAPIQHDDWVMSLAFDPTGSRILSGSRDLTVKVSDAKSGQQIGAVLKHRARPVSISFSSQMRTVLTVAENQARVWRLRDPRTNERKIALGENLGLMMFTSNGSQIITGQMEGGLRVWNARTGKPTGEVHRMQQPARSIGATPDGKILISADKNGRIAVWDVDRKQLTETDVQIPNAHEIGAVHPDGDRFVTRRKRISWQANQGHMQLWSLKTGQPIGPAMEQSGREIHSVAFSSDGKTIAAGNYNSIITLWDTETGEKRNKQINTLQGGLREVKFSPDGKFLAAANHFALKVWNAETLEPVAVPFRERLPVRTLAFSPDSRWIATGAGPWKASTFGDSTVRVWDIAIGQPIGRPTKYTRMRNMVTFSPDGKTVGSMGRDSNASLVHIPDPIEGNVDRIKLWVEVLTTMELDERGTAHFLDSKTWRARKRRLDELGGPPLP